MTPGREPPRAAGPGAAAMSSGTTTTSVYASVTSLTARLDQVEQMMRRRHVLREVSESAEWLRMVTAGECPIESGVFEAHRSLNLCVIDLCKNGGLQ